MVKECFKRYGAAAFMIAVVSAALLLSGCAKTEGTAPTEEAESKAVCRIGLSNDSYVIERWLRERDIFVSAAQELGAEVNVQNANGDVDEQISQIEYFIKKQMDVIVVVAGDCEALSDVMRRAKEAGIKTICYDRLIHNSNCDLYISCDSTQVGRLMAENMAANIPEGGNIFLILGPKNDDNVTKIRDGVFEVLDKSSIKVAYEANCDGWLAEQAYTYVKEGLKKERNIKGIICGNDDLASQAFKALAEERLAGNVFLTGQDGDLAACQRIVEGTQEMTAFKYTEEQARLAAKYAVLLAQGEPFSDVTATIHDGAYDVPYLRMEPIAVTKENMDSVMIEGGFRTKEDVYLNVD